MAQTNVVRFINLIDSHEGPSLLGLCDVADWAEQPLLGLCDMEYLAEQSLLGLCNVADLAY